jgi:hypothetical protein
MNKNNPYPFLLKGTIALKNKPQQFLLWKPSTSQGETPLIILPPVNHFTLKPRKRFKKPANS